MQFSSDANIPRTGDEERESIVVTDVDESPGSSHALAVTIAIPARNWTLPMWEAGGGVSRNDVFSKPFIGVMVLLTG